MSSPIAFAPVCCLSVLNPDKAARTVVVRTSHKAILCVHYTAIEGTVLYLPDFGKPASASLALPESTPRAHAPLPTGWWVLSAVLMAMNETTYPAQRRFPTERSL